MGGGVELNLPWAWGFGDGVLSWMSQAGRSGKRVMKGRQGQIARSLDPLLEVGATFGFCSKNAWKPYSTWKAQGAVEAALLQTLLALPISPASPSAWGKAGVPSPRHARGSPCALRPALPLRDSPAHRWARGEGPWAKVPTFSLQDRSLASQTHC